MKRHFRIIFGAALFLFAGHISVANAEMTDFQKAVLSPYRDDALPIQYRDTRFWLFLPKGYGLDQQTWPALMYLHGSHRRGTDLRRVRPNVPVPFMNETGELPFIVIAPQCPDGERWNPEELIALLDKLSSELAIDQSRVYLTGMSLGAFGTFEVASKYPERFAAIAPISGGGKVEDAINLATIPAWVFHGTNDKVVPFNRSASMVKAIQDLGGDVKFTAYKGEGHDIWTEAYSTPELYSWFLQHRRYSGRVITYSAASIPRVQTNSLSQSRPAPKLSAPAEPEAAPAADAPDSPDAVADVIRKLERNRTLRNR